MWTERQLRIWNDLHKKLPRHLVATGKLVKDWDNKRVLYYVLVVALPDQKTCSIAVAALLTNIQNVPTIAGFLDNFRYDHLKLKLSSNYIPRQIITD